MNEELRVGGLWNSGIGEPNEFGIRTRVWCSAVRSDKIDDTAPNDVTPFQGFRPNDDPEIKGFTRELLCGGVIVRYSRESTNQEDVDNV